MTPKAFLDQYTYMVVVDPINLFGFLVSVTRYGSGWEANATGNRGAMGQQCQQEFLNGFTPAVRRALAANAHQFTAPQFSFTAPPLHHIPTSEAFSRSGFIKAFLGKGSPSDIVKTLRVAIAVGRIGTGPDLAGNPPAASTLSSYVERFISLDCNGLTNNYFNLAADTSVAAYAVASRRRAQAVQVQRGDVAVTVNATGACVHIALIEEWTPQAGVTAAGQVALKLCEWGRAGGEESHYTGASPIFVDCVAGPNAAYGVGFNGTGGSFRYVFAPPVPPP